MGSTLNMSCGTKWLSTIEISTPPTQTTYTSGSVFSPTGMVVTAIYTDGTTAQVTGYAWTPTGTLTNDVTQVTISYTEGWVTRTAEQTITVSGGSSSGGHHSHGDD